MTHSQTDKLKKYMTTHILYVQELIEEVVVDSETNHSVYINGFRQNKACDSHQFHDTYEEALQHLLDFAESRRKEAITKLRKSEEYCARIMSLANQGSENES